jgi:hypothetical protein
VWEKAATLINEKVLDLLALLVQKYKFALLIQKYKYSALTWMECFQRFFVLSAQFFNFFIKKSADNIHPRRGRGHAPLHLLY